MIYIVLNAVVAVFLLWLSSYVDKRTGGQTDNPLVSIVLLLAGCGFAVALVIIAAFYAPARLVLFLGRVLFVLLGVFSVQTCFYCALFPQTEKKKSVIVIKWIMYALCAYFVFNQFTSIIVTPFLGMHVDAKPLFTGYLTNYFPYTWFTLYCVLLVYVMPAFAIIVMLLRAENMHNRIDRQRAVMNAVGIVLCWLTIALLRRASIRVPLFTTLFLFAAAIMEIVFVRAAILSMIYDPLSLLGSVIRFTVELAVPSLFTGFAFSFLWQYRQTNPKMFIFLAFVIVAVALVFSYQLSKLFNKLSVFRSSTYAKTFEEDLAKLDYGNEPAQIMDAMRSIFVKNIGLSTLRILIDNGLDNLESVFDKENEMPLSVSSKDKLIDQLLNTNRTILFRSFAESTNRYEVNRGELLKLFDATQSDAIIILNEGRHILGLLVLGSKTSSNIYSDYDYNVFSKLYSYFFVFGYYMKNIANQSVVGTVNREIKMSSQIITSIQENMDQIKSPHFDAGYVMVPAHNIGGEFIDLIRLTEDRHIFVMGDLSGKGISASMSMVIVKSVIRTFLAETKDFKLLVEKVNSFIRFNLPKGTFFEGVFGLLDFTNNTLYYINCGVPALFLYTRAYNNVIEIQGDGRVLGFAKNIGPLLKVKKVTLSPGDIVMACTDGLIDAQSLRGERFGKDRIQKTITENSMYPAAKMAQFTYDTLVKFMSKELEDDVSILVLKCLGN
jgi:serine phosphatase RsbU (regulator of sigma subunit)